VKEIQARKGSRRSYARVEERGGWATANTPDLKDFIEKQISIFMVTANKECQPYMRPTKAPNQATKVRRLVMWLDKLAPKTGFGRAFHIAPRAIR